MTAEVLDDVALNQTYAHAFARILVRPLLGTWVRPNHLTALRMGLGIASCVLLSVGTKRGLICSGVLWIVTCVLDRADGELARLGDLRSESGRVLDYYSDMILDAGWFLAAGIGLRHGALGFVAVALGALTCGAMILCSWTAEVLEKHSAPGVKAYRGTTRFHPDDALFLLPLFSWFGWLAPVLIGASVCTPIIAVVTMLRYFALKRRSSTHAGA